jgi:tight adherence protein B
MNLFAIASAALFFVAVFLAIEGLYLWWSTNRTKQARRLARRLANTQGGTAAVASSVLRDNRLGANPALEALFARLPGFEQTAGLLAQANVNWSPVLPILGSAAIVVLGTPLSWLVFGSKLLGFFAACAAASLPWVVLTIIKGNRLKRVEELLPDALDMLSRSLRAGHSLTSALKIVGEEMPADIAEEFRRTVDEINFGVSMPDAFVALAARTPSPDMRYFVIAMLIQRETGGNLAEVLGKIAGLVRERIKLRGKIRTLSAEGKASATILGVLPFATGTMMFIIDRKFISLLWTDPLGVKMLYVTGALMVVGLIWMSRLIRVQA